jgi:hypothetical protein
MRLPKGTKRLLSYLLFVVGMQWYTVCALSDDVCDGKFQFKCKNKACVPESFKCDGEDDCGDNSDEIDCKKSSGNVQCSKDQFSCENGKCVEISYRCDGDDDCGDNSDENKCQTLKPAAVACNNETNFQCDNGRCVPLEYTCDQVDDCGDNSDESTQHGPKCTDRSCEGEEFFQCEKTQYCISKQQVCDGIADCSIGDDSDTSDELNCSSHECTENEFKCANDVCIGGVWRCNGIDDCGDGSDEHNCTSSTCGLGQFQCESSRTCISSRQKCNGVDDCQDGSDERSCPLRSRSRPKAHTSVGCTQNEYTCTTTNTNTKTDSNAKCIIKTWLCDGNKDCPSGDDESDTLCRQRTCGKEEFRCNNGQCLPKGYKCDGVADCFDKSDESQCNLTRVYTCSKQTYQCSNSDKCIHPLQFCDGNKDCPHGEDEGPKCGINECLSKSHNCSQGCKDLPIGHVCTCNRGYKLSHDQRTCVDVNECKEFGSCTQNCYNYEGSYACYCDEGFTLDVRDKKTCRAKSPKPYLVFANDFDIREVSLNGDDYKPILSIWSSIVALAVDTREQMLYWADNYNKTISRAPMNNPGKVQVILNKDLKMLQGLDVDWIGRKIYWTDTALKTISVSDLDGSNRKILVKGGPREEFRGIAVHPEKRYIFWTNWVQSHSKIERSNLDGTDRRTVLHNGIVWVSGLALDYQLDRVYWSDRFHRHISSSTIHGSDVRKIVTKLHKPTGLTLFEDKVYWIDSDTKKLWRANKFNGYQRKDYPENLISPMDLVINHPSAQKKQVGNPCEVANGGCSHLCFALPENHQSSICGCPDHLVIATDGKTCRAEVVVDVGVGTDDDVSRRPTIYNCVGPSCHGDGVELSESDVRRRHRDIPKTYVIGGVVGLVCITVVVVAALLYRRRRNQFGLSILYETDADLVVSTKESANHNQKNNESSLRRYKLPQLKSRCKLAIVGRGFDNINFKPFTGDDTTADEMGHHDHEGDAMDLVMEECLIDDDREPIIAHMV